MAHKVWHHHGQMSEAFRTVMFLSASGGLQDAYTYIGRGKVFAHAQTGNIVLTARPSACTGGSWCWWWKFCCCSG